MINEKLYRNHKPSWKSLVADINQLAYATGVDVKWEYFPRHRYVSISVLLDGEALTTIEKFSEWIALQLTYEFLSGWGN